MLLHRDNGNTIMSALATVLPTASGVSHCIRNEFLESWHGDSEQKHL